jgi:hypothetical protein
VRLFYQKSIYLSIYLSIISLRAGCRQQHAFVTQPRACRAFRPTIARRGSDPRRHACRQTHEYHQTHTSSSSLIAQEDEEEAPSRGACRPWPSVCSARASLFPTNSLQDQLAPESSYDWHGPKGVQLRALVEPGSSYRAGSLGLMLIGVALRGGAPPGAEAVRPWQDQAHNKTLCSPSSQGQARCAPAHPAHPAHPPHPAAQGAGRISGKMNASRAESPRPAAALPRASAAPLARPAAPLARPAAPLARSAAPLARPAAAPLVRPAVALPRPPVALPTRPAAALPRAPKAGARRPPKE